MDSFFTFSRKFISASAGVIPLNTHHTAQRGIISCLNRTFTLVLGVHPYPNAPPADSDAGHCLEVELHLASVHVTPLGKNV